MVGGNDIYARMEAQIRGSVERRLLRQVFLETAILIGMIFLLGYLLYAAQFSGGVRWALGIAVIVVLAVFVWLSVARRTSEPRPLVRPPPRPRVRTGELSSLAATVRRANSGLTYSQVSVSSRARDAFSERARLVRGMPPESMRRFQSDAVALQRSFHDALLEDFLFLASTDPDERYRWVEGSRRHGGFAAALDEVLDHMEAWR